MELGPYRFAGFEKKQTKPEAPKTPYAYAAACRDI